MPNKRTILIGLVLAGAALTAVFAFTRSTPPVKAQTDAPRPE